MPTIAPPRPAVNRKPRQVKPAHGRCSLTLRINGTPYRVRPCPCDPGSGARKCFRLAKADGATYHVARMADGSLDCDCPSFEFDHRQRDNGPCKHAAALAACGLL